MMISWGGHLLIKLFVSTWLVSMWAAAFCEAVGCEERPFDSQARTLVWGVLESLHVLDRLC